MSSQEFEGLLFVIFWILISLILMYFSYTRTIGIILFLIPILPIAGLYIWGEINKYQMQRDIESRAMVQQQKQNSESASNSTFKVDQQKLQQIALNRLAASKRAKVESILKTHINDLVRQRSILIKKINYGLTDSSEWLKEIQYFIDNVLIPESGKISLTDAIYGTNFPTINDFIDEYVKNETLKLQEQSRFSESMTPIEFEQYCANQLALVGWTCKTTKASGDQGADVLAEIEISGSKWKLVVQCKLYSSPVGNKAIQEAFSAKSHYGANFAAVVTNNDFTPSAKELAQTTNVQLWHYSDLRNSLIKLGLRNEKEINNVAGSNEGLVRNLVKYDISEVDEDELETAKKIVIGCIDYELKNHHLSPDVLSAIQNTDQKSDNASSVIDRFLNDVIKPNVTTHDLNLLDEGKDSSMLRKLIIERATEYLNKQV